MLYALRRVHALRLRAAHGALLRTREQTHAHIYTDVRVGSHKFDNVIDGGLGERSEDRESSDWVDAPDDLNIQALQIALWKLTQLKFDEALEDYYDHKKACLSEYLRDEVSAMTRERPVVHKEALHHDDFPSCLGAGPGSTSPSCRSCSTPRSMTPASASASASTAG